MTAQIVIICAFSLVIPSLCEAFLSQSKPPKVCSVHVGCMEGRHMPGFQTERFEAFLGIPYALPPVEDLRFSSPKAFPRWSGVLNATNEKMDCIQKNYILPTPTVHGEEDCLYLNVYRPETHPKSLLPVMVYIHGGGWFSGSASPRLHGPEYFMDTQEVILVTFAYRLGPLGFLSTSDNNMPGNFGLKDQLMALRWVQRNIADFGGNPKMVTLFGQSAGAISAHMHMMSKQSEGLFGGIIAMSGTANVPFAVTDDPLEQARKMADLCNITEAYNLSTAKLARALRNIDARTLIDAGDGLKYWDVDHMTNFRPVVENHTAIADAFLTQHPHTILAEGTYKAVPWMLGTVPNEGAVRVLSILSNDVLRNDFNANFNELLEKLLDLPKHFSRENIDTKMKLIIEEYFGGKSELNNDTSQGFLDIVTDRGFHQPLFNVLDTYVRTMDTDTNPVFLYKFNYQGLYSFANVYTAGAKNIKNFGVVHCDDLIYLFRAPLLFADFKKNSTDARVTGALVDHFVHFAKFREPKRADTLQPCNKLTFNGSSKTICDYHEFANADADSFQIKTDNMFNVERTRLWNEILESSSLI